MDEHAAGEASSSSSQAQLPRRTTRRKTALSRIHRLLVSRLSGPLLTSLILLPLVPPHQRHAIFELVPFYKSLKCLVLTSPHASKTPKHRRDVQQWLSYWTLYAFVRFLEATRCNVSTGPQRWKTLQNALDRLPRMLGERVVRLFSIGAQSSSNTATAPRDMTLAAQLAGSATRWTVIKALLLFYAMDEELHGARRIMQKIIKPIFGFFTSLDEEDDLITDEEKMYMDTHHPARRVMTSPEEEEQEHEQGRSVLKLTLEDKQEEDHDEPRTPSTPELSMDGSCGGSDDCVHSGEGDVTSEEVIVLRQDKLSSDMSATSSWPLETVSISISAVEGNHWVH